MKLVLLLFSFFLSNISIANIIPADGFWRTTDDPAIGSGLLISTQGDLTLVSVFTYDDQGNNAWYFATDQVGEDGMFNAELYQTQNGSNLVSVNPQSAEVINTGKRITINFSGNQIGELTVGNSVNKSIQAVHFGVETWKTEHQMLADGTLYTMPSLDGQWVVGSADNTESMLFDLQYDPILSNGLLTSPYQGKVFISQHPSTLGWGVSCPWTVNQQADPVLKPYCTVYDENFTEELFYINYAELGSQKMILRDVSNQEHIYQAFKINHDAKVHSGHWRTHDDPAIGSGVYLVTQGEVTLVILYSYNGDGKAEWGIAVGEVVDGLLEAELLTPTGGKPLYFGIPEPANLLTETKALTLSFDGAEIGSISIDSSAPKVIQKYNYGAQVFETEQVKINDSNYKFPNQEGRWVVVDNEFELHDTVELTFYDPNCCISPTVPWYQGARGYQETLNTENNPGDFGLNLICTVTTEGLAGEEMLIPYCSGFFGLSQMNFSTDIKVFFEDIGVNSFKAYIGEEGEYNVDDITRDSRYLIFYRLD